MVTNFHVVQNATQVEVRLSTDEVYSIIGVRAADDRRNLAILQVGGFKLPTVVLGDSTQPHPGWQIKDSVKVRPSTTLLGRKRTSKMRVHRCGVAEEMNLVPYMNATPSA